MHLPYQASQASKSSTETVKLGDISVSVNKTTVFNADPTREQINSKLKEKAASLGADAVILVRYGKGGIGLMTWGHLEGKGRAIKFISD